MRPFQSFKLQWYGRMGRMKQRGIILAKPPEFFLRIMYGIALLAYYNAVLWFRASPRYVTWTKLPPIEM